jgi:glycosyltransferase involved in cell wall biosynthesis
LRDIPTEFPMGTAPDLAPGTNVLAVNTFMFDEPLGEVIEAARRAPEVTFHVTGRVESHPERVPADQPPNLRFTGFLPDEDYFALMKEADAVMCLTTRDHTMQRGACEALSIGRPIITSDWPLLRDYFHKGTIHVDNTAASIVEAVRRLQVEQPQLEKEIREMRQWQLEQWGHARARLSDLVEADGSRRKGASA